MSSAAAIGLGIGIIIFYLAIIGLGIAEYVLRSLGMYKLAKGRQISDPWMAWLPIVSDYLLGNVTEQADAKRGIPRKWSKVMLVLSIVNVAGAVLFVGVYIVMIVIMMIETGSMSGELSGSEIVGPILALFIVFFVVVFIMAFASVAYTACSYICLYKIFESSVPEKSLKYFLLSMLVPLAYGILLMKCAKQEALAVPVPGAIEPEPSEQEAFESETIEPDSLPKMEIIEEAQFEEQE